MRTHQRTIDLLGLAVWTFRSHFHDTRLDGWKANFETGPRDECAASYTEYYASRRTRILRRLVNGKRPYKRAPSVKVGAKLPLVPLHSAVNLRRSELTIEKTWKYASNSFFLHHSTSFHDLPTPGLTEMAEVLVPSKKRCLGADCEKDAGALQCPTCLKIGMKDSFFCSQDCFKKSWVSSLLKNLCAY